MLASFGDDLLTVALCAACFAGLSGFFFPLAERKGRAEIAFRLTRASTVAVFLLLAGAMGVLIAAYMQSDFSLQSVYQNSHTDKPLFYKIAAAWGNHEGSMLLWALIASLYGAVLAVFPVLSRPFSSRALAVQGLMVASFIAFILFTSDPFTLLFPVPAEGLGLNPVLQDPALAIHPPMLYVGYVGFSLAFSFAVAGLLGADINKAWASALRPYALVAWAALTLGIALGSWWAYYELGWGGWWFWDPVENASFIPWLCATALIHSLIVLEKRGGLKSWTALLALLTFTLSLCGTFLVRSGAITSVHAFAVDPERGVFILLLIGLAAGSGLAIFAARAHRLEAAPAFSVLSRESMLALNSVFFTVGCATVFVGTVYPIALELFTGAAIAVGAPYYEQSFVVLMMPMVALMGIGPFMGWRRQEWESIHPQLVRPLLISLGIAALCLIVLDLAAFRFYLGMFLASWVFVTSISEWAARKEQMPVMYLRQHAMTLAHLGFAIALFGMVVSSHFSIQNIALLNPGGTMKLGDKTVEFVEINREPGPNYTAERAEMAVKSKSGTLAVLHPERRYYPLAQQILSDVAIHTDGFSNIYIAMGEAQKNDKGHFAGWSVRAAHHPLAPWIWFGCVLMALGGLLSLPWSKLKRS